MLMEAGLLHTLGVTLKKRVVPRVKGVAAKSVNNLVTLNEVGCMLVHACMCMHKGLAAKRMNSLIMLSEVGCILGSACWCRARTKRALHMCHMCCVPHKRSRMAHDTEPGVCMNMHTHTHALALALAHAHT